MASWLRKIFLKDPCQIMLIIYDQKKKNFKKVERLY